MSHKVVNGLFEVVGLGVMEVVVIVLIGFIEVVVVGIK
jgi:hypothetical protein